MNISNLLLYSISNNFNEVVLKKGYLPILVSKNRKQYASGVTPVSASDLEEVSNKYLAKGWDFTSFEIYAREFLVFKDGADIVFRHLKEINQKDLDDLALKSACTLSNGVIVVNSEDTEQKIDAVYKICSFINNTMMRRINVLEDQKIFTVKPAKSMLTFFFTPLLDLVNSLRLLSLSSYDVLVIPSYCKDAEELVRSISREKLIVLGMSGALYADLDNILYVMDLTDTGSNIPVSTSKPRINWNLLMENVKEDRKDA